MKRKMYKALPIEAFEFFPVDANDGYRENVKEVFLITLKEEMIPQIRYSRLGNNSIYFFVFYIGLSYLLSGDLPIAAFFFVAIPFVCDIARLNAARILLNLWRPELKIRSAGCSKCRIEPKKIKLRKIDYSKLYLLFAFLFFGFSVVLVLKAIPFREQILAGLCLMAWCQHLTIQTINVCEKSWKRMLRNAWEATMVTSRSQYNIW